MSAFHKVKSSTLDEVAYDPATKTMNIKFKNGGQYAYSDVAPATHADMMKADSIGKFFAANVRGKFPHKMVKQ